MNSKSLILVLGAVVIALGIALSWGCEKVQPTAPKSGENFDGVSSKTRVNSSPSWRVDARCFQDGGSGSFDDIAVKDPSIVNSGGRYHLFYTGRNSSAWSLGYASATSISGLNSSSHTRLTSIGTGGGLAAPQVFYFGQKGRWFLIYQNGTTPSYSTNTDVGSPSGWTSARSMGFSDGGIDYWCISDGSNVYIFYAANDGSHTIRRRSTSVSNFPTGWGGASTVATDAFEAPCVYKNNADGKYYMIVEDMGATRWQELWTASSLGGTWTKVSEQWAHPNDLIYDADHWTDEVSHCEAIRSGTNELLEVNDLDNCTIIFQGVVSGDYGSYASIPYDLGTMHTGSGSSSTTTTSTTTSGSTTTTTSGGGDEHVWLEAECGNVGSLWNTPSDGNASGGTYVTIQSGNNSTSSAPSSSSGHITYNFSVSSSGNYVVWGRVIAPSPNDDSFWMRMDGGSWFNWNNIASSSSWTWDDCQSYSLSAGSHTLTVAYREDGTQLDKVYITNSGDTPSGTGGTATNCGGSTTTTTTAATTSTTTTSATTSTTTTSATTTTTSGGGETCSPVDAEISASFTQNGAGEYCWTATSCNYINSWNLEELTINGEDFTNKWAFGSNLPAKIDGKWYIHYVGNYGWSHFELR